MGGAASSAKLKETIAVELGKPADGVDIDTPRGVSAKKEVKRLRGLLLQQDELERLLYRAVLGDEPSLQIYLQGAFKKYDVDEDGTLSGGEFRTLLNNLELGLTPTHLEQLYKLTDADGSGSVNIKEFKEAAPNFLQKIYAVSAASGDGAIPHVKSEPVEQEKGEPESDASVQEWVRLYDPESECFYWYNKRKNESAWSPPKEQMANIAKGLENKMDDDFRNYLRRVFDKADTNRSGTLPDEELWELIQGDLNLGLSEQEYNILLKQLDVDHDGEVGWEEFVLSAPDFIRTLKENAHPDDCWINAKTEDGHEYYYNAKTGKSASTRPKSCAAPPALPPPPEEK